MYCNLNTFCRTKDLKARYIPEQRVALRILKYYRYNFYHTVQSLQIMPVRGETLSINFFSWGVAMHWYISGCQPFCVQPHGSKPYYLNYNEKKLLTIAFFDKFGTIFVERERERERERENLTVTKLTVFLLSYFCDGKTVADFFLKFINFYGRQASVVGFASAKSKQ
jgi:hypothetical protein